MADSAQPTIPGEYPPLHGGKLFFLTVAIATASFMEILDMTIVNVSVPAISGSLGVSTSEGTWAVSSYMLAADTTDQFSGDTNVYTLDLTQANAAADAIVHRNLDAAP